MFQVLDKKKVKVLVRSDELKRRYKPLSLSPLSGVKALYTT